jgi:hypothetical protein
MARATCDACKTESVEVQKDMDCDITLCDACACVHRCARSDAARCKHPEHQHIYSDGAASEDDELAKVFESLTSRHVTPTLGPYYTCHACFNTGDTRVTIYHERRCWLLPAITMLERLTGKTLSK